MFHRLVIDLINFSQYGKENQGYKYILTVIDAFSKYAWAYPLKSKEAVGVAEALSDLFNTHDVPKELHADNGGEFVADLMKELLALLNIKEIHGAPYTPNVQGEVERFNQTLEREIAKALTDKAVKNWVHSFQAIVHSYNMTFHSSIKLTPFEGFTGRKPHVYGYIQDLKLQGKYGNIQDSNL